MKRTETTKSTSNADVSRELLLKTARMLEDAVSWVLLVHIKLDGDALGCVNALFEVGASMGKRVRWVGSDPVPPSYSFLPHVDEYLMQSEYDFDSEEDLYVALDSSNEDRVIKGFKERSPKALVLNIDHHEDNTRFGSLNCVNKGASSTSELLWSLMLAAGWSITHVIAECLYIGLTADTGWFSFGNTTALTHVMAADLVQRGIDPAKIDFLVRQTRSLECLHLWGAALARAFLWGEPRQFAMTWLTKEDFSETKAVLSDTEALVNQLLTIRGVRFAVLLTEDGDQVRGSFRSREGIVTAASVARILGGGGHPRASGARLALPINDAVRVVKEAVEKAYAEWALADR